jgi:hypothetical protein
MWLFFWQFSKKFPRPCCLDFVFGNSKMANSPEKNHCCRSFHQVDYFLLFNFVRLVDWQSSTRGLAKLGYRSHRKVESFGYLPICLQHARPSSLNLAISQFFPSKYGDFGKKIPRKNLCMKNLWRRIWDEKGVTRVKVPNFSLHG